MFFAGKDAFWRSWPRRGEKIVLQPYQKFATLRGKFYIHNVHDVGLGFGGLSARKTLTHRHFPGAQFVTQGKNSFHCNDFSLLQIALSHQLTAFVLLFAPNMCPSCNGDAVNGTNGDVPATTNSQVNGTNGYGPHTPHNPRRQPFASVGDFLSNVSNFKIIESTLREGEQVSKDLRF